MHQYIGIDPNIAGIIFNAAKKPPKSDVFVKKQNGNFVKPLCAYLHIAVSSPP